MDLYESLAAYVPYNEQESSDRRLMLRYGEIFDDLLTRQNEMAHFTASAWVVNAERTRAVMAYHNLYQSWAWLGGHADGESDLRAVAEREVREESGLERLKPLTDGIFSLEILGVAAHRKHGRHVSAHLHLNVTYLFEADERSPIRPKPDENRAVRWFDNAELLAASSEPEMRVVYQKLLEKTAALGGD
jgi:8-oxo-dGTP pyrophosphatase MutT (NUDIX family)